MKQNEFFGSKLNTVLLVVLIILMFIAIRLMLENKELYLHPLIQKTAQKDEVPQILGNKNDLISFSILPNTSVHGVTSYKGIVKGGYFFEGNILIGVVDLKNKIILQGNAKATTDWTVDPVSFEGSIDFSKTPNGPAYIQIHNDNPSGLPKNDKYILIPITIK